MSIRWIRAVVAALLLVGATPSLWVTQAHAASVTHPPVKPVTASTQDSADRLLGSAAADLAGGKLVFVADRVGQDAPDELYMMNGDGSGERPVTQTSPGNALFPEWSPNGKTVAYHVAEAAAVDIFLKDIDAPLGEPPVRLTSFAGRGAVNPAWSPNGKQIAFNSFFNADIYVINIDGSDLTQLTDDPANDARPDWSPDGRHIIFNSNRDGNAEIYVMNANGTDPVRLTNAAGNDVGADWSPNGKRISFESSRDGNREIYVMDADGDRQTRLTSNHQIDAAPSWSPDGHRVVFHRQLFQLPGRDAPNGSELFVVDVDSGHETRLTFGAAGQPGQPDTASFSAFPSWAPGHIPPVDNGDRSAGTPPEIGEEVPAP